MIIVEALGPEWEAQTPTEGTPNGEGAARPRKPWIFLQTGGTILGKTSWCKMEFSRKWSTCHDFIFLTLTRMLKGLLHAFKEKDFQVIFTLVVLLLLSGTIFYHNAEGLSILDALYFCVTTLTTVGHATLFRKRTREKYLP